MKRTRILASTLALLACSIATSCNKKDSTEDAKTETAASAEEAKPATTAADKATDKKAASKKPDRAKKIPAPDNVAAAPAGAEKHDGGMASLVLTKGTGTKHPKANDKVKVHYTGWTKDGKMFDSSVTRDRPSTFGLNQVIKGWTEGVQLMVKGEKRRFWIPGDMAYGDKPKRPGTPSGQLTFDIELLEIIEQPDPPPVPKDVAAAPADAKTTKSGLKYKVLKPGTGTTKPTATQNVEVHYSGWTTDGKMFDSSVVRGQPANFRLNAVIKGWTEGVQLMVEGEKTRFWIPGELAYGKAVESVATEINDLEAALKKECKGSKLSEPVPAEVTNAKSGDPKAKTAAGRYLFNEMKAAKGSCEKRQIRKLQSRLRSGRPMGTLVFDIELLKMK